MAWKHLVGLAVLLHASGCFGSTNEVCQGSSNLALFLEPQVSDEELAATFAKHEWIVLRAEGAWAQKVHDPNLSLRASVHRGGTVADGSHLNWTLVSLVTAEQAVNNRSATGPQSVHALEAGLVEDLRRLGEVNESSAGRSSWDCSHGD